MSIIVTCDGCGKVEQPRREDICDVEYRIGGDQYNKDFCAKCEEAMKVELLKTLNVKEGCG